MLMSECAEKKTKNQTIKSLAAGAKSQVTWVVKMSLHTASHAKPGSLEKYSYHCLPLAVSYGCDENKGYKDSQTPFSSGENIPLDSFESTTRNKSK